jgi:hypothetical protein
MKNVSVPAKTASGKTRLTRSRTRGDLMTPHHYNSLRSHRSSICSIFEPFVRMGLEMRLLAIVPRLVAGLPWTAWLLWLVATGLGLAVVLLFYFRHRRPSTERKS